MTTDIILQVLSKPQAALRFSGGKFVLKDVGSSNGTFINNFRLSQAGLESEETVIYSDDVLRCRQKVLEVDFIYKGELFLRFGSEIETDGHKSKCVICKVRIYSPDGAEGKARAISDR